MQARLFNGKPQAPVFHSAVYSVASGLPLNKAIVLPGVTVHVIY